MCVDDNGTVDATFFYGNGSREISLINQTLTVVTIYWTKIGYCDICNGWVANESPKITQSILLSS